MLNKNWIQLHILFCLHAWWIELFLKCSPLTAEHQCCVFIWVTIFFLNLKTECKWLTKERVNYSLALFFKVLSWNLFGVDAPQNVINPLKVSEGHWCNHCYYFLGTSAQSFTPCEHNLHDNYIRSGEIPISKYCYHTKSVDTQTYRNGLKGEQRKRQLDTDILVTEDTVLLTYCGIFLW